MRRHMFFVTAPACAVLAFVPVAARADIVPAPPSSASAVAAQVGSILDISKTDAAANRNDAEARASVLRLGGQPLFGLGGEQKGQGETGGALLDTGQQLPVQIELAPWKAAAGKDGTTRKSKASAALARARLEKVLNLKVLASESEASHSDAKSTGTAVSDGVDLQLLDAIRIVLLHSEVGSEGQGQSYLVGLNDTRIGTGEQLGKVCSLELPSVAALSCLRAAGGTAGPATNNSTDVATLDPTLSLIAALDPVAAFTAAGTAGIGADQTATDAGPAASGTSVAQPAESTRTSAEPALAPTTIDTVGAAALPRTGAAVAGLAAAALTALLLGGLLRRFGRRSLPA